MKPIRSFHTAQSVAHILCPLLLASAFSCTGAAGNEIKEGRRWTTTQANEWYAQQPWPVGANFLPSTASNQLEMWQAATFDPKTIDKELGWAADVGYNLMRVYLHDLLWQDDPEEFIKRIDTYLSIADGHGIKTMLVLFDSVWDPRPELGPQKEPVPHVHNSRWVQSPHIDIQKDPSRYEEVEPYLTAVLTRFKDDKRILAWDLLNEPGNPSHQYKDEWSLEERENAHVILLGKLFTWARKVNPSQPLTAGIWVDVGNPQRAAHPLDKLMLEQSDIITFHTYGSLPDAERVVEFLLPANRPLICTEYMSRGSGSLFETHLPYFKENRVGAINWGLVNGRSQTIYPWASWDKKFTAEPELWFHDVFRKDGTPYDTKETELIHSLTQSKK